MKIKITVLTLCAMLFALCLPGQAQQPKKVPRIGYQSAGSSGEREQAFRQGLRELGYIEGQNIVIEWRYEFERVLGRMKARTKATPQNAIEAEVTRARAEVKTKRRAARRSA